MEKGYTKEGEERGKSDQLKKKAQLHLIAATPYQDCRAQPNNSNSTHAQEQMTFRIALLETWELKNL